jgi:sigma-B regulation protein RsbU (phosphoserine phosphatase)
MVPAYVSTFIVLFQMMAVIVILAYLITRTQSFSEVLSGVVTWKNQLFMIIFFGIMSIYGTESGILVLGAPVNIRDLGPMVGGLACGPVVGLGAGLIGAAYRFGLGGFTCTACSLATILAGFLAGVIYLLNHRKFVGWQIAVSFAILMEGLHMGLVLLLSRPFPQAVELVSLVAAPMILANAVGMLIFAVIIQNLVSERKTKRERDAYERELERKKAELEVARDIQMSLLPATLPDVPGIDLAARSIPAKEVGGDFYDVILLPGHKTGLIIADVSGKGVPAALFMALSRTVLRATATWHARPGDAIRDANAMITADAGSGMFVTLFFGVYDAQAHQLTYVNAGHNPPILFRNNGLTEELRGTGIALGVLEETHYNEQSISLSPGDLLVLYTDGVTEAMDAREEQYGTERLLDAVRSMPKKSAAEVLNRIVERVNGFSGPTPQYDDVTLMILRVVAP